MKAQSNIRPTSPYTIDGDYVRLDDLSSIKEIIKEDETLYEYDSYIADVVGNENYIKDNYDKVLLDVKKAEYDKLDAEIKSKRKRLLEETDNYFLNDRPTASQEMKDYRQALRDITQQENYPYEVIFPIKPNN